MAEANILGLQDQFSCPVCLDLLKDPVAIQCGHSFCMRCINDCWNQEDQKGVYSCPQCRQTFTPRPAVSKNTILVEVMETLKKAGIQAKCSAQCAAGPEDVECDSCTGRKFKAVKSCLVCLASFCETHLQPHYISPAFKKHKLVEASRRLQEQICSQHDKLLEVYCRTDQKCICTLCTMDEHKGHDAISAAAGREEKQKPLLNAQAACQEKIKEREQELQELTKAVEAHKNSAQTAVQETKECRIALIQSIKETYAEVIALIRDQEETAVSRAEDVIEKLKQEIADLKKRNAGIQELSHTEDPIYFLQSFKSLVTPGSTDLPSITTSYFNSFGNVVKSVSQLKAKMEACSREQYGKISREVKKIRILQTPSREEFLPYFCQFTLDPKTAHQRLRLSDSNKTATDRDVQQTQSSKSVNKMLYPEKYEHRETFNYHFQVLCKERVCGRSYWELDLTNSDGDSIAVSYKDISRKGSSNECVFGRNNKSWSLVCYSSYYSFLHNNQETRIQMNHRSSRIGVFVDYKSGILSFYSVSDKMKLLHRVRTTFTQPLYPGFGLNTYSTVKLRF